jgi:hypothetical protein
MVVWDYFFLEDIMEITYKNKSMLTGIIHQMTLNIGDRTPEMFQKDLDRYREGREYIQDIFPYLTTDEREFVKTGITTEEWDRYVSHEDDPFPHPESYEFGGNPQDS